MCHWLEDEGVLEKITISEIHKKMTDLAGVEEVYSMKRLREKLLEYYGDHIFWSQLKGGREDVLCFRDMASYIVHEKWHAEKNTNAKQERERIVCTCAKLLREEIREQEYCMEKYPSTDEIRDIKKGREFLTPLTRIFIETLIKDDIKQNSIGQSLTQAVRPRSMIAPLLFGIGVEMGLVFGSRWLIDELYKLGFLIPYDEVNLFKQSILQDEDLCTLSPPVDTKVTQWACDNADHDIKTIDVSNQFHGMSTISMYAVNGHTTNFSQRVQRKARLKVSDLISNKGIPIVPYNGSASASLIKFKPLHEYQRPYTIPPAPYYANLLWQSAHIFSKSHQVTPNYSGFMQHFFRSLNEENMKWNVLILPLIDLNPNDETCVYSVLLYIQDQSKKMKQPSASITFDQPLWQKAVEIIEAKKLARIVGRLGGYHLLMSACGSVGNVMKGSGLEEAMGQVYGPNTVNHIMTGKAIIRALRAHLLVEKSLMTKLVSEVLPRELEQTGSEDKATQDTHKLTVDEVHKLEELFS